MLRRFSRRDALRAFAMSFAGAGLVPGNARAAPLRSNNPAAAEEAVGTCTLYPESVEGPFYFDPKLVREDITDGRPGLAMQLSLRVLDQGSCSPLAKARVDVWHADASGLYSGYARQGADPQVSTKGESFLRGTQLTDTDGRVTFRSIVPGWYPGRTPHIHMKIFIDERTVLTGQIYFPDKIMARIYREHAPYASRGTADTTNASDWIFQHGGPESGGTIAEITDNGGLVSASLLVAINREGPPSRGFGKWFRSWLKS